MLYAVQCYAADKTENMFENDHRIKSWLSNQLIMMCVFMFVCVCVCVHMCMCVEMYEGVLTCVSTYRS